MAITISNIGGGLNTRVSKTNVNKDEFVSLKNAISWRRSLVGKPGTNLVGRLAVLVSLSGISLSATGTATIDLVSILNLPASATLSIYNLSLTDGTNTWTGDVPATGNLTGSSTGVTGTVNYSTCSITLSGGTANGTVTGTVSVYYGLPVLGFANWANSSVSTQLIFDQKFAYAFVQTGSGVGNNDIYMSSNFFSSGRLCSWNGNDNNLFQSVSAGGSLFVSNQTPVMQFGQITAITLGITTTITIANHGQQTGDYVWLNEIVGTTQLNGQTAQVLSATTNTFTINVDSSGYSPYVSGGIAQYLTSNPNTSGDGIRYYYGSGFVNFAPPTTSSALPDYICGCKTIIFFGSRICLFGVFLATSAQAASGSYRFVPSIMYYSSVVGDQVGSPYYTTLNPGGASFVNPGAFYAFPAGQFGGYISFPSSNSFASAVVWKLQYAIVSMENGGVYRLDSTTSAIFPFERTLISPIYGGSGSNCMVALPEFTFVASRKGFLGTDATTADRIDFVVPNLCNSISSITGSASRSICCIDTTMECLFYTFPSEQNSTSSSVWNDTSVVYNYRDNTWAIFDEHFSSYGELFYSSRNGHTYASLTKPWSAYSFNWTPQGKGFSSNIQACGNQQGYILSRQMFLSGAGNAPSLCISSISSTTYQGLSYLVLGIYNHNLVENSVIYISNCLGAAGTLLNGSNFSVVSVLSSSQIILSVALPDTGVPEYLGCGQVTLVDNFAIETKAFSSGSLLGLNLKNICLQLKNAGSGSFSVYPICSTSTSVSNIQEGSFIPFCIGTISNGADPAILQNNSEQIEELLWKRVSVTTAGTTISALFTKSPDQMLDSSNNDLALEINSIILDVVASGDIFKFQ